MMWTLPYSPRTTSTTTRGFIRILPAVCSGLLARSPCRIETLPEVSQQYVRRFPEPFQSPNSILNLLAVGIIKLN